jgi:hypothetical protein
LADGESSSSGDLPAGDGYGVSEVLPAGWSLVGAVCDDGSPVDNISLAEGETVTCTFTNTIEDVVAAAIVVTVVGTCTEEGGEGEGRITVTIPVDGGATVIVRDSDGNVVGTFTESGSVAVPEGATYTWQATPSEGFEFPPGAASSGTVTIATCSIPDEVESGELPFTGLDAGMLAWVAAVMLGTGLAVVEMTRRREDEA